MIKASASTGFDITPHDTNDLAIPTLGIYVGVTGNLKVTLSTGGTVTYIGLLAGVIHPISAKRVFATGTTATNIIGMS